MPTHLPHLKTLFIVAFIAWATGSLNAQSTWHAGHSTDQYLIEYSDPTNCSFSEGTVTAEYIFLKISNLTAQPLNISFRVDHYYVGSGCGTCNNDEYKYSFTIPAHGSINAGCDFTSTGKHQLAIFKKFTSKPNKQEFEKFEITQIVVE